jgi:AcrR family transcriptional regulator
MTSNKSRPSKARIALEPQRRHGKLRFAALLEAGAGVIADRGFEAATMAEIAAKAGAPIGSLYRFFPSKEILADTLAHRFLGKVNEAFDKIQKQVKAMSAGALAEGLLSLLADIRGEKPVIRALLEVCSDPSLKRQEFRQLVLRRIAHLLTTRCPGLGTKTADTMAIVLLQNLKTVKTLGAQLEGAALSRALAELKEMTRLYLRHRLGRPS